MKYPFHTTKHGNGDHVSGSYKQGVCNYNAWLAAPQIGADREMIVHLTDVVGTVTILDVLSIARHCRDQMLPAWYAGRPTWARAMIQGRVWADAVFLDREPVVWWLTPAEVSEIERCGYYNPYLYDKEQELLGVSRIIRAEDEEGQEWQALKRPGELIASLDWDPV